MGLYINGNITLCMVMVINGKGLVNLEKIVQPKTKKCLFFCPVSPNQETKTGFASISSVKFKPAWQK